MGISGSRSRFVSGAAAVALGLAAAQVAGYVLTVTAARALGPSDFGAFAALLGLLLIGSVIGSGFQAAGARRLVVERHDPDGVGRALTRTVLLAAAVAGVVAALLTPVVRLVLDLPTWSSMLLIAAALVPVVISGGQYGVAQGRERLYRLGAVYAVAGLGKGVGGSIGAVLTGSLTGALVGLCLGAWVAAAAGHVLVRGLLGPRSAALPRKRGAGSAVPGLRREALHAAHALAALYVLTNADVLCARALLSPDESGAYAVGAIIAKVAFWLPQVIVVVAFPRMVDERRGRAIALAAGATAGLGAAVVAATAVAPALILSVVAGPDYSSLSSQLWLFAAVGSLFAVAQTLLFARIAVDDRRAVLSVWLSTVVLVALAFLGPRSVLGVVLAAAASALIAVAVGAALAITERRRTAATASG